MSEDERPEETPAPEPDVTPEEAPTPDAGGALDDKFLNELIESTGGDAPSPVSGEALDQLNDETELNGQGENDDLVSRDNDLAAPSVDLPLSEQDTASETPSADPAADPGESSGDPYDVDAMFAQTSSVTDTTDQPEASPMTADPVDLVPAPDASDIDHTETTPKPEVDSTTPTPPDDDAEAATEVTQSSEEEVAVTPDPGDSDDAEIDEIIGLDPSELDALAAEMEEAPGTASLPDVAPDPLIEDTAPDLSEDEIAAMVGAVSPETPEADAASPEGMSQSDLDSLLAEAEAEGAIAATDTNDDDTPGPGDDLDALLTSAGEEQHLDGKDPEAPLVATSDASDESVTLDLDSTETLGTSLPEESAAVPAAESEAPAAEAEAPAEISDDLINALVSAASGSDPSADVGSENIAAAASENPAGAPKATGDQVISQDDLDALIEAAKVQDQAKAGAAYATPPPVPDDDAVTTALPTPKRVPAGPGRKRFAVKFPTYRAVLSLAAGLLVGVGVFVALQLNRETRPTVQELLAGTDDELQLALRIAQDYLDDGSYGLALQELEGPMTRAKAGPDRTAGEFLALEARVAAYLAGPDPRLLDELHAEIDRLLDQQQEHLRRPDALYWKAQLFLSDKLPIAAQDLYDEILEYYPGQAREDALLYEAAKLAMRLHQPTKAATRIQQLINEYPGSRYATESRLLLGDAYAEAGLPEDARTLYMRSVARAPTAADRAAAILRLGKLAYNEGRYPQAIADLDNYLSLSTTTEGSDAVFLLLAQAYRANSQFDAARDTLNDLLNFFEPSEVTPDAFVELSQVLDALGQRDDAIRLAKEATIRFPENPTVLRNAGVLHGLDGNPFAAAGALLAAETFGANEPRLLLTAARHLRTAGLDDDALNTYRQLQRSYPGLPDTIVAGTEEARIRFDQGHVEDALDKLDQLAVTSAGGPEQLIVLRTQAELLTAVGMVPQLADTARELARIAQDDQDLAQAAAALLRAGELEEAQNIIGRTDLARLRESDAHGLLVQLGESYLQIDPRRAIDTLEEAYRAYPAARTPASDMHLLKAYIAANRAAAARRIVFEIAAHVAENPIDAPHLIDATINYGDYLFDRKDYRAAADAYAQALDAALPQTGRAISGVEREPAWAKFQRANALLELADFDGSIALYTEISTSEAPWAADAAAKAEYARLEQQLRGITPTAQQS